MTEPKRKVGRPRKEEKIRRRPGHAASQEVREIFLEVLRKTGNVGEASEVCGVYRTTPYGWRKNDPAFAKKWDEAMDSAADLAEAEVRKRAVEGWHEPVYYKGVVVGERLVKSDRMLELYIKALKPEKFREKAIPDGQVLIQINGIEELQQIRSTNPWNGQAKAGEAKGFTPVIVKTEELPPRSAVAAENGRANAGKRGMIPGDGDEYYDEGEEIDDDQD